MADSVESIAAGVGGLRLRVAVRGEGEPVLFLPGLGNGRACWDAQISELHGRFRCIAFDPRDVGQSDPSPIGYGMRTLAEDAIAVLDALGIRSAHVVGWSMGGAVAQELAIGWPDRVRRLALIATYADTDERGTANLRGWAWLRRRVTPLEFERVLAPWVYSASEYARPGLVEEAIAQVAARPAQPVDRFERQVEATVGHRAGDRLTRISAPTLLLFGSGDALTPPRFADALARGIRDSQLTVLDDAGHALLWTRTAEVNQALSAFLSGSTPSPT